MECGALEVGCDGFVFSICRFDRLAQEVLRSERFPSNPESIGCGVSAFIPSDFSGSPCEELQTSLTRRRAFGLVQVLLEASEHLPDLRWIAEIRDGV
jgi:hypothetical protein